MEINNVLPENGSSDNDNPESEPKKNQEDGRLKEWQDRGRVALPDDIAPGSQTTVERDFEPENVPTKKPKDNTPY